MSTVDAISNLGHANPRADRNRKRFSGDRWFGTPSRSNDRDGPNAPAGARKSRKEQSPRQEWPARPSHGDDSARVQLAGGRQTQKPDRTSNLGTSRPSHRVGVEASGASATRRKWPGDEVQAYGNRQVGMIDEKRRSIREREQHCEGYSKSQECCRQGQTKDQGVPAR
jgi:hypothetical protein